MKARLRRTGAVQKIVWPTWPSGRWAASRVRSSVRARAGSMWLHATAVRHESHRNWSGNLTGSGRVKPYATPSAVRPSHQLPRSNRAAASRSRPVAGVIC